MTKEEQIQALNQAVGVLLSMTVSGLEAEKHVTVRKAIQKVGQALAKELEDSSKDKEE